MLDLINNFRKELQQEIDHWVQDTGKGRATSWDDYKQRTGVIAGLEGALNLFNDIVSRNDELDDDPD